MRIFVLTILVCYMQSDSMLMQHDWLVLCNCNKFGWKSWPGTETSKTYVVFGLAEANECCWCVCIIWSERSRELEYRVHIYFSYTKSVHIQIVSAHVCYMFLWLIKCCNVTVVFIHWNYNICFAWKWMHITLHGLWK